MVELELLEGGERSIAGFEQGEALLLVGVQIPERVRLGLGLAQERQRDENNAAHREQRREDERDGRQVVAGMPTSYERATSRRCSRASGQSVIADPSTNTNPAIQMRFTSGFTNTRK